MLIVKFNGHIIPNMCRCIEIGDSISYTVLHNGSGDTNYHTPIYKLKSIGFDSGHRCSYRGIPSTIIKYDSEDGIVEHLDVISPLGNRGNCTVKYDVYLNRAPKPVVIRDICLMCELYDLMHRNGVYER